VIDVALLIACGIAPTQARQFAEPLAEAAQRFRIDTAPRVAAFVAQVAHESANFTRLEENLYYTTPERVRAMFPSRVPSLQVASTLIRNPQALANRVYANRLGNGDEGSGDGWRYRGRGLIQLTGRWNYHVAGDALARHYITHPEIVAQPSDAAYTAAWFWASIHGNDLADSAQIDELTRRINGPAMAGADDRRSRFDDNMRALA
jgi:putative chitinase